MLSEIIKGRRSVFPVQYNQEPITKGEIETILEAANWAPTHRRTEPWRFKVMQGDAQQKLAVFLSETYKISVENFKETKYLKYQTNPLKAGCIIAICMQRDPKESIPEWEEIAATAMAVQNMWLTAHNLNIGAYWSSPSIIDQMHLFFNLEEGERCLGLFYMGKYNNDLPEGIRKTTIEDKTEWL